MAVPENLHWQLRSLVGTDEYKGHHYVYFPVPAPDNRSSQVHSLDVDTRETAIVKRLSFNPRCLVARNGWVCCGGELGIFTAFRVGERRRLHDADREPDFPDNERLLGEVPSMSSATSTLPPTEKDLLARSNAFGKDRVNCITLWSPPTLFNAVDGAYDQDIAVLANNDSSVMVVSLGDQEALDKITYPDYMNRGVISPDGRLLVAISDDPYLYIHERKEKKSEAALPFRGSFAACFSSTGRYLAVGTQYGTISIFDAALLGVSGADPLLTSFNTSRSNAEFGAVRDMAFSPGPIDLLAWTEDRGRILYLDKEDDFEHLGVNEQDSVVDRCTIDPRLLEQRADRGERGEMILSGLLNAFEPSSESRPGGRLSEGLSAFSRYNVPLTAEETAVLNAIQDYRQRQDQYGTSPTRAGAESTTNNGTSNTVAAGGRPSLVERALRAEGARNREQRTATNRTANEVSQRDRLRTQEENGAGTAANTSTADRRRYAAINPFSAAAPSTTLLAGTGTGGRGALISRLLASATNPTFPDTSGLRNADALYDPLLLPPPPPSGNGSGGPSPDVFTTPHPRAFVESDAFADLMRLSRAAYFMRDWEENPGRRGLGTFGVSAHSRPGPYDTAGLSWSEDGERL
ncbi:hypothetical protein N0V88_002945 [Collariella sp. IMI 366227]|nr:hypothetical protein N0V88_002945 [Collariella sp. IMI 366227]